MPSPRREHGELPLRRALVELAVMLLVLALFTWAAVWFGMTVWRVHRYNRVQRVGFDQIAALANARPQGVEPAVWAGAQGWVRTAYANICFSEGHVTYPELVRFEADLKGKLRDPVDLTTLVWIWNRLGQTGPHGAQYIRRFEPSFREALPQGGVNLMP